VSQPLIYYDGFARYLVYYSILLVLFYIYAPNITAMTFPRRLKEIFAYYGGKITEINFQK